MSITIAVITRMIFFLEVETAVKRKITECVFYNVQARMSQENIYDRYKMCLRRYKVKE